MLTSLGLTKSISDMLSFTTRAARGETIHCQVAVKEEGFSLLLFELPLLLLQEEQMVENLRFITN